MNRCICLLVAVLSCTCALGTDAPTDLRCEWRVNPTVVSDPCPEFFWRVACQSACQVLVAEQPQALGGREALVWDSGRMKTRLPIVEYAGPKLRNGVAYYWTVRVWDDSGRALSEPPAQRFTLRVRPMRHHLPTIRTFINFAGSPAFARDWLDLCFRAQAKQGRQDVLVTRYGLICTMVVPHPSTGRPLKGKAKALADFCRRKGFCESGIAEEMFCHFAQDTYVRLHVGAERASQPIEKRLCPGWDSRNDRDGDGVVSDAEAARMANPKATARRPRQARIPMYYWGPPNDDFVMNVGAPAYREFMAKVWAPKLCEGVDGIYFDTVPPNVPGAGASAPVVEYPRRGTQRGQWLRDLQTMFAEIKIAMPDKLILGNGWDATPMTADGRQSEGWEALNYSASRWRRRLDHAIELDRRGKVQLIQYNPIFDPKLAEFGPKLPVSLDRDRMFGLATYLLAHGRFTFYGYGRHPYARVTKLWFPAMRVDLGEPVGQYKLWARLDPAVGRSSENLLPEGGFERWNAAGQPDGWIAAPPLAQDRKVKHSGTASVRLTSETTMVNNINKRYVRLKPHTAYTLIAWAKTDHVEGRPGAQVYPYEFKGVKVGMLTWTGTKDWSEQRLVFRTGDDAEGRINFRMYGATGTVWFDDIWLVEGMAVASEVFGRRYTKGLVLVKPPVGGEYGDPTATTHRLPDPLRPLHVDGSLGPPTHEVRLRSGEAAILLR